MTGMVRDRRVPTGRLLAPMSQAWDWQLRGACRNENGGISSTHPAKVARTRPVARRVPGQPAVPARYVRRYALAARESDGIRGRLSREDRYLRVMVAG
jgi:hypothetical protein